MPHLQHCGRRHWTPTDNAFVAKINEYQRIARPLNDKFLEIAKTSNEDAVQFLLMKAMPATTKWQDALREFTDLQRTKNQSDEEAAISTYGTARLFMLSLTGFAILLGGFIAWFGSRSITGPLNQAVKVAQTVAAGDLTSRIDVDSTNETGQLLLALKNMNEALQKIVGEVRAGADAIATASSHIASGNMDLSSRTEQQAGSLEETASSMEELTSTVKQNADNSHAAASLAMSASEVARRAAPWWRRWSTRWAQSTNRRRRSSISSA
jgi:methyl-accepting chemotaxis protein